MQKNLEVNKRILNEIDALKVDEKQKLFLKEIIDFELNNIDKDITRFTEEYKNIIVKVFR
jgi:hypothetical protein